MKPDNIETIRRIRTVARAAGAADTAVDVLLDHIDRLESRIAALETAATVDDDFEMTVEEFEARMANPVKVETDVDE